MVRIISLKQNIFVALNNIVFLERSVLGPLLFLIYIDDSSKSSKECGSYLYTDETCIFYQHN